MNEERKKLPTAKKMDRKQIAKAEFRITNCSITVLKVARRALAPAPTHTRAPRREREREREIKRWRAHVCTRNI